MHRAHRLQFYRRLQPVQALSFDLDDTLYDNPPVLKRAEQRLVDWLQQAISAPLAGDRDFWRLHKNQVASSQPELMQCSTQWRLAALTSGALGLGLASNEAQQLAQQAMERFLVWRSDIQVPAENLALLEALAQRYPLAVITNGNADVSRFMPQIPFACVLNAGPDGPQKPAPDLFHRCCQQLGLAPSQLLHIGDHPDTDVAGALSAGCQAVWLNPRPDGRPRPAGARLPTAAVDSLQALRQLL
ncbi:HAD-IA family hydrolase [Ferrimonas marina]|uniref:Putative hydrolase of the HAD superfamily n=1 Tax=Ferrimonas marina TaxID=299255 RepID=A0A1M5XRD2_9GAMM|nr:HAD-IA family hydrolase [Ferrimonas marina]SHI02350.1 putative hydrolase of the HAD superfamily [Ferrimonas marina]